MRLKCPRRANSGHNARVEFKKARLAGSRAKSNGRNDQSEDCGRPTPANSPVAFLGPSWGTNPKTVRYGAQGGNAMWLEIWAVTIAIAVGLTAVAITLADEVQH